MPDQCTQDGCSDPLQQQVNRQGMRYAQTLRLLWEMLLQDAVLMQGCCTGDKCCNPLQQKGFRHLYDASAYAAALDFSGLC